jgi:hypothetical protein
MYMKTEHPAIHGIHFLHVPAKKGEESDTGERQERVGWGRRRRSLFRIVYARGAIPNDMGVLLKQSSKRRPIVAVGQSPLRGGKVAH